MRKTLTVAAIITLIAAFMSSAPVRASSPAADKGNVTLPNHVPDVVKAGKAKFLHRHDAKADLSINLGLPLRNQAQLDAFIANQASNRQYMTNEQFDATYAPTSQQVRAVKDWAASQGLRITYVSPDGLAITGRGTTSTIEAALHVQLNDYSDPHGFTFYSTNADPTVPASLGLQAISGLDSHHRFHTRGRLRDVRTAGFYPVDFQTAYDLANHGYDGTGQTIGLTLWGAAVSNSDLGQFATDTGDTGMSAGPGADQIDWLGVNGNTGSTDSNVQGEIAMDVEYSHGMATHSHLKYWLGDCSLDAQGNCAPSDVGLEDAISAAANDSSVHVVSNSWGGGEAGSITDPFVVQTGNSFQHAVAVGTTFYFSTGDHASNSGGTNMPSYPADSPYVVAVGGTNLQMNAGFTAYTGETAWSTASDGSGGGGGCSGVFARPSWQTGIEATCSGRAIPDISADADPQSGAFVYVNGGAYQIGGTSLAAPLTTGMAAVTNRYLSQNGKPLMGWAAPTMYRLANDSAHYNTYFHDVTCGNNGFSAGAGWSEATGWGSEDWYQYTLGFAGQAVAASPRITSWSCVPSSGTFFTLRGIACPAPTTCYAAGDGGDVYKSTGGWTWNTERTPIDSNFLYDTIHGVACPTTTVCYAVGQQGQIVATTDGTNWSSETSPTTSDLLSVACPATSICYAVGTSGVIIKTTDGIHWTSQTSPLGTLDSIVSVSCPSTTTCYAMGLTTDKILKTTDGSTWSLQTTSLSSADSSAGISCPGVSTCFAAADASGTGAPLIIKTTDGAAWTEQTVSGTITPYAIACTSATSCDVAGTSGGILSTTDGSTWTTVANLLTSTTTTLRAFACGGPSACYAAGDSGTILDLFSAASLLPSTSRLIFGKQATGITSAAQSVTVTNGDTATVAITGISTSGDFAQTNTCGASLAPGANCTISVTFTPSATGLRNGALTIAGGAGSPQLVALTGNVDLTPPTVSFTSTPANPSTSTSASFSFTASDPDDSTASLTFECELDSQPIINPCPSPQSFTGLTSGTHNFAVAAFDPAGREGLAVYTWSVNPGQTVTIQTGAGWNMVGGSPLTLWSDSQVNWSFNAATPAWFTPTVTAPTGTGAWEYVSTAGPRSVTVQVCPTSVTVPVTAHRWNLVGNPCNRSVSLPSTSRAYWWDPSAQHYVLVTSITPGAAAWVKPDTTSLTLS